MLSTLAMSVLGFHYSFRCHASAPMNMFPQTNPTGEYREQLECAAQWVRELLESGLRAQIDQSGNAGFPRHLVWMQAHIARDYFLWVELEPLEEWDAIRVLKLRRAVQEATRPQAVSEWDIERIESALTEFWKCWFSEDNRSDTATRDELQVPATPQLRGKPREAYETYLAAEEALGSEMTDDQAYDWAKNKLDDPTALPDRGAWKRSLGKARQALGTQKRKRRVVPESRSILSRRALD